MYLSFSIERGGYELKRIIAASLEARLKDLQQVESSLADDWAETLYVHSSVCMVSKNSGLGRQS